MTNANRICGFVGLLTAAILVRAACGADSPKPSSGSAGIVMPRRGICAHRGASQTHPENTLSAFREAIRLGAHQIELDVALTKDARLVLMHDRTVDRTTNGSGPVAELTLEEIKKLDAGSWKHRRFAGERVPTLGEALEEMPENVWLNLHLKGDAALGAAVAREVVRQGRTHQAFLACGRRPAEAARRVEPEILICNMERQDHSTRYVDDTIARRCHFIQLLRGLVTPEDMARLKDAGVRVNYCCTNDPRALVKLFDAGVEFPLVDDLGTMINKATSLGIEPLEPVLRGVPPQR
jgi:glycerophosphoryl diester phosphodiesterase